MLEELEDKQLTGRLGVVEQENKELREVSRVLGWTLQIMQLL